MRILLAIFVLCAWSRTACAIGPFIPSNVWYITTNYYAEWFNASKERALDNQVTNTGWYVRPLGSNVWVGSGPGIAEVAYGAVPTYLSVTNAAHDWATQTGPVGSVFTNWTFSNMWSWLDTHYTNSNGQRGVGIFTNDVWYWTVSNESTNMLLGAMTYGMTGTTTTATGTLFHYAWVYEDGGRVVYRPLDTPVTYFPYWFGGDMYAPYPFFDVMVPNVTGVYLQARVGDTTRWSSTVSSLAIELHGMTNYDDSSEPSTYGTNLTLAAMTNGETLELDWLAYDLGGYDWVLPVILSPTLVTNGIISYAAETSTLPPASKTNFMDRIECRLRRGALYAEPISAKRNSNAGWSTPGYSQREYINERMAVLSMLRFQKRSHSWTGSLYYGTNAAHWFVTNAAYTGGPFVKQQTFFFLWDIFQRASVQAQVDQTNNAAAGDIYYYVRGTDPQGATPKIFAPYGDDPPVQSNVWYKWDSASGVTNDLSVVIGGTAWAAPVAPWPTNSGYETEAQVVIKYDFQTATNDTPLW